MATPTCCGYSKTTTTSSGGEVRTTSFRGSSGFKLSATSDSKPLQRITSVGATFPALVCMPATIGAVIGLVLLLRLAYTKITGRALATGRSHAVHVLARVAVAPRSHILLVQLGQRILVVGESAGGLNALATIDEPDEVSGLLRTVAGDQAGSITRSFSQLLDRFNSQYPENERPEADRFAVAEHATGRARDQVSGLLSRLRSLAGRTGE